MIGADLVHLSSFRLGRNIVGDELDLVFTNEERSIVEVKYEPDPVRGFATLWACKEAVVKCGRTGFSAGMYPKAVNIGLRDDEFFVKECHMLLSRACNDLSLCVSQSSEFVVAICISSSNVQSDAEAAGN